MDGGETYPRTDWMKSENEMILGASSYMHMGRIKIRSKLMFDDGSNNFVSGIIQSEDSPVRGGMNTLGWEVNGQTIDNPWNDNTTYRRVWGLDHALPTAQWVLDKITERLGVEEDGGMPPHSHSSIGYGMEGALYSQKQFAEIGSYGFRVYTGYASKSDLIFGVMGNPPESTGLGWQSWGMRLASRAGQAKVFVEDYGADNATTGYFNFFKARGGVGMYESMDYGSAVDRKINKANNGAIKENDKLGVIQCFGQARGNGVDRDPCTNWVSYKPAARIVFRATDVQHSYVGSDIEFSPGFLSRSSIQSPSMILDRMGYVFMGETFSCGGFRTDFGKQKMDSPKGRVTIKGRGGTTNGLATLALWDSQIPSLSFSGRMLNSNSISTSKDMEITDARIAYIRDTTTWAGFTQPGGGGRWWHSGYTASGHVAGLYYYMWDDVAYREAAKMVFTTEGNLVIGEEPDDFKIDKDLGKIVITTQNDGFGKGFCMNSYRGNFNTQLYYDSIPERDNWPRAILNSQWTNEDAPGNYRLFLNTGKGQVFVGDAHEGQDPPKHWGKLVVNGNIAPAKDNEWDLGLPNNRFDDVYATNGTIQVSDRREKKEIKEEKLGLDFINKLNPVAFKRKEGTRNHHGLIAQNVEKILKEMGKDSNFFAGLIHNQDTDEDGNKNDVYGLRYEEFIGPIIKAIQEIAEKLETK